MNAAGIVKIPAAIMDNRTVAVTQKSMSPMLLPLIVELEIRSDKPARGNAASAHETPYVNIHHGKRNVKAPVRFFSLFSAIAHINDIFARISYP